MPSSPPLAAVILSLTLWNDVERRLLTWWTAGLVALCLLRIGTNSHHRAGWARRSGYDVPRHR